AWGAVRGRVKVLGGGDFNTCGKLIINKGTVPSTDTTTVFPFTTACTPGPPPCSTLDPSFSLTGGGPPNPNSTIEFDDVLPCPPATECYSVTGGDPSALGDLLTGLTRALPSGGDSTFTPLLAQRKVTINVARGETVSCTFTNSKQATLTVNKICVPAGDTGKFNLQIDGATAGTGGNASCGGTTGAVAVSLG